MQSICHADYFYIHAWMFPWVKGTEHLLTKAQEIISLVRKAGPWFDRKKGADHMIVIPNDQGR